MFRSRLLSSLQVPSLRASNARSERSVYPAGSWLAAPPPGPLPPGSLPPGPPPPCPPAPDALPPEPIDVDEPVVVGPSAAPPLPLLPPWPDELVVSELEQPVAVATARSTAR